MARKQPNESLTGGESVAVAASPDAVVAGNDNPQEDR